MWKYWSSFRYRLLEAGKYQQLSISAEKKQQQHIVHPLTQHMCDYISMGTIGAFWKCGISLKPHWELPILHPQMVRGQAGSDAEHWPWTRIRLKNPSAWWIDANHAKPFGQRGLSAVPRPSPAAQMLYMKTSEVGGWFTHRARSSLDDDRCNSWTAVTETLHREGAPSPCCPSSDAGLSCWNTATKRRGGGSDYYLHIWTDTKWRPTYTQTRSPNTQAIWAKANNELFVFLQQPFIQSNTGR